MTPRVTSNPDICGGKPCIAGTRMRVLDVLEYMAGGDSAETLLEEFPYITRVDIQACLAFAAERVTYPFVLLAAE